MLSSLADAQYANRGVGAGWFASVLEIGVAELEDDPYPIFAWLRANAPVHFVEPVGAYLNTRSDGVTEVAARPEDFGDDSGIWP